MSDRRVVGGKAHLTGIHEKGPQGPRVTGERLREVRSGDNGPSDGWYEFDCTPTDAEGREFGPMPEGAEVNPEFEGVPTFDGDPSTQALRLQFTFTGEGTAELVHEYANHGCTPRIKTVGARGQLVNLAFVAANGVRIPVEPSSINIGRQDGKGDGTSAGSAGQTGGGKHGHRG